MVCIPINILNKYLTDEEACLFQEAPALFSKNTISTTYKENLIEFFKTHIPVLENLIELKYNSLLESHAELIVNILYKYIYFHKNHNETIYIKNDVRILKRAFDYIQNNDINNLTVADLSKNIFVHTRTLQYIFKQHLGLSPKQFIKIEKLNLVRRELMNADCYTANEATILKKHSVVNLDRFRKEYNTFFRERPVDTLLQNGNRIRSV